MLKKLNKFGMIEHGVKDTATNVTNWLNQSRILDNAKRHRPENAPTTAINYFCK